MDFNNRVLTTIDVFGFNGWITESHLSTWIIMAFLILVAIACRIALTRFTATEAPKGWQNFIELIVETFSNFADSTLGPMKKFGGWFFGVFVFVLASNFSGLFGLRPPTADLSTALVISVVSFILIQFTAYSRDPIGSLKGLFEPIFVFLPMNLIGELSVIVSLAFRLFGNILSGLIIVGIIYYLLPAWLSFGLPVVLHAYFDIFAGAIQAFIITMLSMSLINLKT